MYSSWQLKWHAYFHSSGQFDFFGLGDHKVFCATSDSELVERVWMRNSTLIAETGADRQIMVILEEWSWFDIIGSWKAHKLEFR